ncbi:solute carrier family 22 member 6 [Dasypus novemcinctus]|uniref:solute carrier family 22 member 6 n=1 Tax=Dasypus novemcinctus TaxID=9361 RepID=UPI00265E5084|nr:solute carrier family 22 member 6-like [Dasypus novemcinctus]
MEWMPIHTRACVGTLTGYTYSLGQFLLAGAAYAVPHWRHLRLLVSVPFFAFFIYSWFFVESARWYSTCGRPDLTLRALQRVASINGKREEGSKLSMEVLQANLQKELTTGQGRTSALELLRCPTLRRLFLCLSMLWFATSFAYYGLVMDLQNFGVSIYLIQVIFGAVDLPAKFVGFLVINFLGRRPAQMASLLLAGICILANGVVPKDYSIVRTALAVLGKGCLTASFNCIFLYTGELYPTMIRQTGLGMGSTMARVGSIVSPLVSMTAELYSALPLFIFGAVPVAASAATALLPETLNQPLPDTVQDLKDRRGKQKRLQQEQQKQMVPLQASAPEKSGLKSHTPLPTRFATSFAYYGLVMDLQNFGVSIYLIQVIFGAVDLPAKFVGFLVINFLGRRPAQMASLLLVGICILANGVVPKDYSIVRTALAVLGKGCLAASFNCIFLYTGELYPTMIRQTGLGMGSTMARVGSIVSPLVSMTAELYSALPLFIFGAVPVAASAATALLPETLNQPLPDTVQDLKDRRRGKQKRLQQEQQKQMVPLQASAPEKSGL